MYATLGGGGKPLAKVAPLQRTLRGRGNIKSRLSETMEADVHTEDIQRSGGHEEGREKT